MKKNVYVAYNYADTCVAPLAGVEGETSVKDYADVAEKALLKCKLDVKGVYRSLEDNDDLTGLGWVQIWDKVKDKLADSQATVMFISPAMMDPKRPAKSQWPAWNLYFSLHGMARTNGTNSSLPVVAVVLPDKKGSTAYFDKDKAFPMLKENIDNDYIYLTNWSMFLRYPDMCIDVAEKRFGEVSYYDRCFVF